PAGGAPERGAGGAARREGERRGVARRAAGLPRRPPRRRVLAILVPRRYLRFRRGAHGHDLRAARARTPGEPGNAPSTPTRHRARDDLPGSLGGGRRGATAARAPAAGSRTTRPPARRALGHAARHG